MQGKETKLFELKVKLELLTASLLIFDFADIWKMKLREQEQERKSFLSLVSGERWKIIRDKYLCAF